MLENRSIAYVSFSTLPSAADSAAAKERIVALKTEMDTVTDIKRFLSAQGVNNFNDSYVNASAISPNY